MRQSKSPAFQPARGALTFVPTCARLRVGMSTVRFTDILFALLVWAMLPANTYGQQLPLDQLKLPTGFEISLYARVPNARSLALTPKGTLFVGTRADKVYAIPSNGAATISKPLIIGQGLNMPNGVAFRDGTLYVAEINRVLRYNEIESRLTNPPNPVVLTDSFPKERSHGWKFIAFGPDGMLYVPVGAPCNICEPDENRYANITRMQVDNGRPEVFARGIRNTVGFDWHPTTKELWFTDNGRDQFGDDIPPDELNHAPKPGLHFGYPYCHGGDIPDDQFGKRRKCTEFIPPAQKLGPHVAALGMRFYTGAMFPSQYRNQVFIAEHGSWNRSTPIGYRITVVQLENGRGVSYKTFAEGWLQNRRAWGRPVDVLVMPDGALLVSDDEAGAIYRIVYKK